VAEEARSAQAGRGAGDKRAPVGLRGGVPQLPPGLTVLQIVPELETGGAEQTTIDMAAAIVRAGGRALVASQGGRMESRLADAGGELVRLPVASKSPLTLALNGSRLLQLIRREGVGLVHARSRAPAFSALRAARAAACPSWPPITASTMRARR
jgi:hypothetical protein